MITEQPVFNGSRTDMPWNMYEPDQAAQNADTLYPLVVSLHGGYGREVDDGHILVDGAPFLLGSTNGLLTDENRERYPTYIIAPWCQQSNNCNFFSNEWSSNGGAFYSVNDQPSAHGEALIELIEHMIATHQVDPARIYVTGVSMGGGGTWEIALRRPDLIAAAFPLAGHTPSLSLLDGFGDSKVPVWAFSGSNDNVNSHNDTDAAVAQVQNDGGCAWVTKYDGFDHGHLLWQRAYLNPGLWPWLFAQKQPRSTDPVSSSSSSSSSSNSSTSSSSSSSSSGGQNLLSGGSFSAGMGNFTASASAGTTIDWTDEARFNITQASTNIWDDELLHAISIEDGAQYTLCFDAKADASRSIVVGIDTGATTYSSLVDGDTTVSLGSAYESFSYTYTATASDATARLQFKLGADATPVSLDNIALYEGSECID